MQANLSSRNTADTTHVLVRFPLGQIVATHGALEALEEAGQSPQEFISRHARLEQGELSADDHKENLFSVDKHLCRFSTYKTTRGVKIWCITESG